MGHQVAALSTVSPSAVFVVNQAGTIVWREQFGQKHAIRQGQLEAQITRALAGEELIKVNISMNNEGIFFM